MGYTASQAKQFIEHIAPMIQAEGHKRGYKIVSTVIAQAIIEGAAGTSSLAKNYHNHFGLKCGTKWKGASVNLKTKEEYLPGTLTTIKDNFRAYSSDEEGVRGYYDFISTSRYTNLKSATTPRQYAEMLKADGYATSSTYVTTLTSTVSKYNLDRYDTLDCYDEIPIESDTHPTLRKGDCNEFVRAWQIYLNAHGYDVGKSGCDGKFGSDTERAVMRYQQDHGFEAGYVGAKTWATLN